MRAGDQIEVTTSEPLDRAVYLCAIDDRPADDPVASEVRKRAAILFEERLASGKDDKKEYDTFVQGALHRGGPRRRRRHLADR